jgi:hypothetical protein
MGQNLKNFQLNTTLSVLKKSLIILTKMLVMVEGKIVLFYVFYDQQFEMMYQKFLLISTKTSAQWIFNLAKNKTGIVKESAYTLYNKDPRGACAANKTKDARAEVDYVFKFPKGDEEAMKCHLALYGPMHVSISIENTSLVTYKSGIWDDPEMNCTSTRKTDHAVFLVGYGTELGQTGETLDYWIVQNSWGTTYGTKGFFKIKRGVNMCLIATNAMYPVLKTGKPRPFKSIYPPTTCTQASGDVFSSTGVYIKSICIDQYGRNYANSGIDCTLKGMRLYQLDSEEAKTKLYEVAKIKWTENRFRVEMYVSGKSEANCTTINNYQKYVCK